MIAIYSEQKSSRLNFILTQLFTRTLGCDFYLTTELHNYLLSPYPGIAYCQENPHKGIWIKPTTLLFNTGYSTVDKDTLGIWNKMPVFFLRKGNPEKEEIPFDLFAASFYLLSRMEEYYSSELDKHSRYKYEASILCEMGCITHPIVDEWAMELKKLLLSFSPDLKFNARRYRFIPTIDVDHPFLYRNKGVAINSLCLLKDLACRNFKIFWHRLIITAHLIEDPYFNFNFILKLYRENQIKGLFFSHRGPYGQYDRRYIFPSKRRRKMMKTIDQEHCVLLHPSYVAAFNNLHLCREKMDLERVLNHQINASRQHYLRIRFPESFRLLQLAGIYHDYSVLYSNQYGFRTGTSIPFPFYDIENERETSLMIHTTAVMDVTLKKDFLLSPDEAFRVIKQMEEQVKRVGGDFITLFHNSSLAEIDDWKGWRRMYVKLIKNLSTPQ